MNVTFSRAIELFFSNYATFTGRTSRRAYWWVVLFLFLMSWLISGICWSLGLSHLWIKILSWTWAGFVFIPNIAITVRRLHDVGKGGGWIFIFFVPLIGPIWLLILMLSPGEGENRFGPMPYEGKQ